jgi:hypothetical protein
MTKEEEEKKKTLIKRKKPTTAGEGACASALGGGWLSRHPQIFLDFGIAYCQVFLLEF